MVIYGLVLGVVGDDLMCAVSVSRLNIRICALQSIPGDVVEVLGLGGVAVCLEVDAVWFL